MKRDELVVVLGTGVSASLSGGETVSTWRGLLEHGIDHVCQIDKDAGSLFEMRLEKASSATELTSIAQDLRQKFGDDFGRWLADTIGSLEVASPELAEAIANLSVPILTTNYDTLVETALGVPPVTWANPGQMRDLLLKRASGVGHLHGIWSDAASVVFSTSDYHDIMKQHGPQSVQKAAFVMKTFLFVGVGTGVSDPNFGAMVEAFSDDFGSTKTTHFRLCLDAEIDASSAYGAVVDIGYGAGFRDLPGFLSALGSEAGEGGGSELRAHSRDSLLEILRDKSTLWRDAEAIGEKTLADLVVAPVFLPEPHDQYATSTVLGPEREKPAPLNLDEVLTANSILVIAGEESSGVSTAVVWAMTRAMDADATLHGVFVDKSMAAGKDPIGRDVQKQYRSWGVDSSVAVNGILGVDNLRLEDGERFTKAIAGLSATQHKIKIVGVRESDALDIASAIQDKTGQEVTLAYLGRFSKDEVREIARRVAPGREEQVARHVMIIIREKNLPRTPFTATLLVELVQSGVKLKRGESEILVLDQFLDLLLSPDFNRLREAFLMTARNKRLVLETLARKFVEQRADSAPQSQVFEWLSELFTELGWSFDAMTCINDLVERRVLARGLESTIRFQRSAYLELMAGIAAKGDETFRGLVLGSPLQLASIVRTYAAMARNDSAVLDVIDEELDRILVRPVAGNIFAGVRQVKAVGDEVFRSPQEEANPDDSEEPTARPGEEAVERQREIYYDDSDDSDAPAFMTSRVEELSDARIAMLVVDLASRVLRDSDEVRDQSRKEAVLEKILVAWVRFTDLYELEMSEWEGFGEQIVSFFPGATASEEEIADLRRALLLIYPSLVAASGIRFCLSGPSLIRRLADIDLSKTELGSYAALTRTMALYSSGSTEWIDSLKRIDEIGVNTFFAANFISALARYAYIVDKRLSDDQRSAIRDFLRRVVSVRYRFDDIDHRNRALNSFEDTLRKAEFTLRRKPEGIVVEA